MVDLDELEKMLAEATAGEWRPEREPPPVGNFWFDDLPPGATPIESQGTFAALGLAVGATASDYDARLICALRNAAPELIAEIRRLRWYEEQWQEMQDGAKPSE